MGFMDCSLTRRLGLRAAICPERYCATIGASGDKTRKALCNDELWTEYPVQIANTSWITSARPHPHRIHNGDGSLCETIPAYTATTWKALQVRQVLVVVPVPAVWRMTRYSSCHAGQEFHGEQRWPRLTVRRDPTNASRSGSGENPGGLWMKFVSVPRVNNRD
jgi:hypothetical protein